MHGADVDGEITLLSEGAVAVRVGAEVGFALREGLAAVVDVEVLFQVARGGAGLEAGGADGRVRGADVRLQKGVGGETESSLRPSLVLRVVWVVGVVGVLGVVGRGVAAFRTPEARAAVAPALVDAQLARRLEAVRAGLAGRVVELRARVRLLLQVHGRDVFLQGGVFPEGLVARRVLGAAVLLPPFVRGVMSP